MNKLSLIRLSTLLLLWVTALFGLRAQQAEAPSMMVTVNGKAVERKVTSIDMAYLRDNVICYNRSAARVRLTYAADSPSAEPTRDYIHPFLCRVLFGEAVTGIRDLRLYEITRLDGENLSLQGLPEGQLVQVYNTAGRLCLTTRAAAGGTSIGIRTLPKDVYIIKAGKTAFKFVNR